MTTAKEIRKMIEQAREIQSGSTAFYRDFQKEVLDALKKVRDDKHLSPEGKLAKEIELKADATKQLLQHSKARKDERDQLLIKARNSAERLVNAEPQKPDEQKAAAFKRQFNELKTELMLATNHKSAQQKLNAFVESVDEPALFAQVRDDFSALLAPIVSIAGPDAGKVKMELSEIYSNVKGKTMNDDQHEAGQLIESAGMYLESKMFDPIVETAVQDNLGRKAAEYLNKPHFFNFDEGERND